MGRYNTSGSNALAPNDPYNDMDRADYRPKLQVIQGGKTDDSKSSPSSKPQLHVVGKNDGKDTLRDSEDSALSGGQSFFTGSGKSSSKNIKDRIRFKNTKKRIAIIATIIAILGGGATFLSSSHSLLAPAIEKLTTLATDTQNASYTKRQARIMKYMLGGELPVENTWTGAKKYTKMTSYMKKRLKAQGIEVEGSGKKRILKFDGQTITADDFMSKFRDDVKFRDAYMKAKRGRVAGFFDNVAKKIYDKLGITRNLFKNFKQDSDAETSNKKFRDTAKTKFDNNSTDIDTDYKQEKEQTTTDAEGNKVTTTVEENVSDTGIKGDSNNSDASSRSKAKSYVSEMAGKAGKVADGICGLMKVGSMISAAVAANQIYQSINYYMTLMENPSKMMAGDGDESAVNETLNLLTTPTTGTFTNSSDLEIFLNDVSGGDPYTTKGDFEEVEVTGAPIEANGLQMMLAGAPAQKATTNHYSLESTMSSIAKALNMSTAAMYTCMGVDVATSTISLVGTIAAIAAVPATGGLSLVGKLAFDFVVSAGTSIIVSTALSFIVPTVAKYLFTNVFETVTGIPAGEMLARGASAANTRIGRSGSGQSPSSQEEALAYNQVNQEVLAMEAEVDRLNRSPFDITSNNTFLGSIAYKLLPLTTKTSAARSAVSNFSTITRLTTSSIASLTGSALATGENSSYMTTFGECDQLGGINASGDIYCNPITTTDVDLIDMEPDDDQYVEIMTESLEDCDQEGNCTIGDNSGLAKYIVACSERSSPFGIIDQNILGEFQQGNIAVNSTPLIGDIVNLANTGIDAVNLKWATGAACVNSEENEDWETYRYYQRYIEDQRILEQMGAYDDSPNPVTAYLEKYEAEHPLDNSPAGYLARISGLTKENAEIVIAVLEYSNFIENYNPETRIAMNNTTNYKTGEEVAVEIQKGRIYFSKNNFVRHESNTIIASQHIIYADVRNRSYITA